MDLSIFAIGPFLVMLVAIALRLTAVMQPESNWQGWKRALMTRIAYLLMAVALVGMVIISILVPPIGLLGFFVIGMFIVFIAMIEIRFAGVRNRARQTELLWVLAMAVRSNRPLADEIESYAEGSYGRRHRQLMDFVDRLREGTPLTEIVVPQGLLPISATMQIHSGIVGNSLADSLSKTARRVTDEFSDDQESEFPGGQLAYPPMLMLVGSLVVGFVMYYIIPKFKRIFEDFNTELPGITISLIHVSDFVVNNWFILGFPVLLYLPIGIFALVCIFEYHGWNATLRSILGRWFVRWHTPDVLRSLSQGISSGEPIVDALRPIVQYAGPVHLRKRLALASEAMVDGTQDWQALHGQGVINHRETVALEVAHRTGSLRWALDSLASNIERRRTFRIRAFLEFVQPAFLFPIGLIVAFIVIALFMPLIKLLNDLS